mgnify:CR=1 FL=1
MAWGIMIIGMGNRYYQWTISDEKMYHSINETLSSKNGQRRYGMKLIGSVDNITDEKIDGVSDAIDSLVERLNSGKPVDVKKELEDSCQ